MKVWRDKKLLFLMLIISALSLFYGVKLLKNQTPKTPAKIEDCFTLEKNQDSVRPMIPLFQSSKETDFIWTSLTPAAKRICEVVPDKSWLKNEPVLRGSDFVYVKFFDDVEFRGKISRVTKYINDTVGFSATSENGSLYLTYCDEKISASLELLNGEKYAIEFREGRHFAIEVDREKSDFKGCGSCENPALLASEKSERVERSLNSHKGEIGEVLRVIDVMVLYTPASVSHFESEGKSVNRAISLAMEKANLVHFNSETKVYLNLVYSEQIDYSRGGKGSYEILQDLTKSYKLREARELREEYGADLVCLVDTINDAGGLAWLLNDENGSESLGFSLIRAQQIDWTYTLVHEWGHNMGCGHSKTQKIQNEPGIFSYSSGWQWDDLYAQSASDWVVDGYCTVMTYEDFDNDKTNDYFCVPYFSSPSISYKSQYQTVPTGHAAEADNARTIRETAFAVAEYRESIDPDYDNDGLSNVWELKNFGTEIGVDPLDIAANGVQTFFECYISGIDPLNPNSLFRRNLRKVKSVISSNGRQFLSEFTRFLEAQIYRTVLHR